MTVQPLRALCCICGSLRECRRPRNHRHENYWLSGPIDLDWHRETADLKCAECGRVTTHALLHPEGDSFRDHAEMMQRVATGNSHGHFENQLQLDEVATKYRQGLPRNPLLHHYWWAADAQAAWNAGRREVRGLCGEIMAILRDPAKSSTTDGGYHDSIKPRPCRDQEYEDSDTGLWWAEMDCVDCLRVWHLELLNRRRKALRDKLTALMGDILADNEGGYPKRVDLRTVDRLLAALEAPSAKNSVNAEGDTQ